MSGVNNQISFEVSGVSREELDVIIDRDFREFGVKEDIVEEKTVEQFFQDYEEIYYKIPAEGDINSHRYLVERSSQLLQVEKTFEDIKPLLDEIASLKEQALQDRQTIVDLNNQIAEMKNAADN